MAINYPQRYDDDFLNTIKTVIDHANAHGKTIQDLVADGQLTEEQYAHLLTTLNGLIKSGEIKESDLSPELRSDLNTTKATLTKKANKAETAAEIDELNDMINNLILSSGADSSVEVQAARKSVDGTSHDLLSQRLDADFSRTARTTVSTIEPSGGKDGDLWLKPKQSSLYEGVKLNGSSSYIDMSDHVDFINGKLSASDRVTLEVVVSFNTVTSSVTVIGGGHTLDVSSRYKYILRAGYDYIGGGTGYGNVQYSTNPVRGKLYLTLVYDGTNIIIYENGEEKERTARVGSYQPYDQFVFGRDNYSLDRYLNGTIFDIRLWDKGLTPEEVKNNVGIELTGAEEGLIGYWDLSEKTGNIAYDKSLNGLDGTIYDGEWVTSDG